MEQHRRADHTQGESAESAASGADGARSASQRRAGSDSATRDYQRQMQELDSAGTVEEAHDREAGSELEAGDGAMRMSAGPVGEEPRDRGGDAADGRAATKGGAAKSVGTRLGSRMRDKVSRRTATLGLAASSLAMLAGVKGGAGGAADEASVALAEGFMPPEEVTEKKGVTWDLHLSEHERVDFFVEFLMGKNYDKTRLWLERIGKYGPMVQNELRERGMPEDLLYLTMIESGLNPNAYSKAHAAGLWQFIEETGERYGLEVSTYVDERRDPVKATDAALTYLSQMHDRFGGSWYLSAAGYNTGENRVGRLMRETTGSEHAQSEDAYWKIWDRLPSETRDYVPLMLAMGKIAKEPEKYGFTDLKYQDPLQFEQVTVPGGTKLADIAKTAGIDPEVIYDLNPHLVKKQTPPKRDWAVRVPVGQGPQVAAAFGAGEAGSAAVAE